MACNAQILELVMGLPKVIDDTQSAEQGLSVLSLLQGMNDDGLAVTDWQPAIAGSKPNSVWADSAVSPGRTLISAEDANPIEIINLTCSASTWGLLDVRLKTLSRFRELAQNFWETDWQVEPIYLKWWAIDGIGPQYALIYSIDFVVTYPDVDQHIPLADVVMTIEREPYWRALPPGQNPKVWSLMLAGLPQLESNLNLLTNNNHLISQNIKNTREWNTTQTAVASQNYVDIPASKIPGDAPALVCLFMRDNGSNSNDNADSILVGRSTKTTSLPLQAGGSRGPVYMLNAGDSLVATDTTKAADTSAPASNSSATGVRTTTTFATATMQARLSWDETSLTAIDAVNSRGQFAAFLRCRISAAANVNLKLVSFGKDITIINTLNTVIASPNWNFLYMGQVQFPLNTSRIQTGGLGVGPNTKNGMQIVIHAERTSGAGNLHVADLILLPVDECSVLETTSGTSIALGYAFYDNTGYFTHGTQESIARVLDQNDLEFALLELSGRDLTLLPNVDNRLHFVLYEDSPRQSYLQSNIRNMDVSLNIVPRWRGVRDA